MSADPKAVRSLFNYSIFLKRTHTTMEYGVNQFSTINATIKHNEYSPIRGAAELTLWHTKGFWPSWNILRALETEKLVTRAGAYYKGSGLSLGPGRGAAACQLERLLEEQSSCDLIFSLLTSGA